jgi:hypothetical protein
MLWGVMDETTYERIANPIRKKAACPDPVV